MTRTMTPILYSFRRCPYAMRARLGLFLSNIQFEWREILLKSKPQDFLDLSKDGTVPILVNENYILQESIDIYEWALNLSDPFGLMRAYDPLLPRQFDQDFKLNLDRYKYHVKFEEDVRDVARNDAKDLLMRLESRLEYGGIDAKSLGATDYAILPFIRQFAYVDIEWFRSQKWPNIINWLEKFENSDIFQEIMKKQPLWEPEKSKIIIGQKPVI